MNGEQIHREVRETTLAIRKAMGTDVYVLTHLRLAREAVEQLENLSHQEKRAVRDWIRAAECRIREFYPEHTDEKETSTKHHEQQ